MYTPLRYIDPSGWAPREPGNGQPDDPPGFVHYRPGIYNPTDSESAWLVRLPDAYVNATSDGYTTNTNTSNTNTTNTNTTTTPYTEGTPWNNYQQYSYLGTTNNTGPTLGSGVGGGGSIGMGANNQFGNSKLTPSVVNYVVTGAGTITGYQNSLWEKPKSRAQKAINQKKAYETQKALKQKGITKSVKEIKAGKITNLNKASNVLGATGVLISSYELYTTNEIKPSHLYDFTASATCFALGVLFVSSPAGWIAGAVFLGAEVVSYAFTGQSVGEHLNNNINWSYKRY